ncbi:MAG: type I methionyl aminopeptidase [Bacteroidia bacterium]|nr:type I methionyl aminopeptidase [Bacteroidia bacterium]
MGRNQAILKTEEEIELIRQSCLLVSKTLGMLKQFVVPGVSTLELDTIAEAYIRENGGIPAFLNYQPSPDMTPFPNTLCISVNEEVVHGLPSRSRILKDGDIVSLDCGVLMNGFFGDSAYTFPVGTISSKKQKLLDVTKMSLLKGIQKAIEGNYVGDISNAVQTYVESYGFSVVREMVGHGLGKSLHEAPEVPNYGRRKTGMQLQSGLVIAIEPMINMGRRNIKTASDDWTIFASDMQPSAHFEHTIVIRKDKAEVLTTFEYIEK